MALKPLDIFKFLPKTNCKECGFPTCLAFAMQLALGKTELAKCPHISEEARKQLAQASAPPIRTVIAGPEKNRISLGGETVLFRHEKTFYNPPGIGVHIQEKMPEEKIEKSLQDICQLSYNRVGLQLTAEVIAIQDQGQGKFLQLVEKAKPTGKILLLMSQDTKVLRKAVEICRETRPILFAAEASNWQEFGNLAKEFSLPLVIKAGDLESLVDLSAKLSAAGWEELILYPEVNSPGQLLRYLVLIRRAAISGRIKELGYPVLTIPGTFCQDSFQEGLSAALAIAKYGSLILLSELKGEILFPLLLERLNIFTDPQRPMATPQGIYKIGQPGPESPVLITSNFSLTYFIVSGEIENSRVPAYLLVLDTEGLSVLTAWAADKFNAEKIGELIKQTKIEEKISHRNLILPGVVTAIVGELEEELPGWKIILGPREAVYIPVFLRNWKSV